MTLGRFPVTGLTSALDLRPAADAAQRDLLVGTRMLPGDGEAADGRSPA
jgi:hypothetical protein